MGCVANNHTTRRTHKLFFSSLFGFISTFLARGAIHSEGLNTVPFLLGYIGLLIVLKQVGPEHMSVDQICGSCSILFVKWGHITNNAFSNIASLFEG